MRRLVLRLRVWFGSCPSGAKAQTNFHDLTARVELVPFPVTPFGRVIETWLHNGRAEATALIRTLLNPLLPYASPKSAVSSGLVHYFPSRHYRAGLSRTAAARLG